MRCFYKCTSSKRKAKENMGLLLSGVGHLMTKGIWMSEVLDAFLLSQF